MSAPELILAVPGKIVDNRGHDLAGEIVAADVLMNWAKSDRPVWGTADKALLAGLIERGRAGEIAAMEALYEMFKTPIFGLAYRHTQNRAVAEDLLQDVFLKIFGHLRDVRDADTFPAWVFRIALNTCYSYLRQKRVGSDKSISLTDIEGKVTDEGAEPVEKDLKEPLERAIRSLPPRLRSVFVLHDVQGYKHEEISRLLKCSVGTSKSQLFKARMKLRALLKATKAV
jgi:RNA polymerase sigma-70 factor (ECF subfamily)